MLEKVSRAFEDYFAMIVAANELALERKDDDAVRLIKLRRELAQKTADVQTAVDQFTRKNRINDSNVPQLQEHRKMFSAERGAVSMHQSRWVAPAMRADRNGYEADVRALFGMHEFNHRWRMRILVPVLSDAVVGGIES